MGESAILGAAAIKLIKMAFQGGALVGFCAVRDVLAIAHYRLTENGRSPMPSGVKACAT